MHNLISPSLLIFVTNSELKIKRNLKFLRISLSKLSLRCSSRYYKLSYIKTVAEATAAVGNEDDYKSTL